KQTNRQLTAQTLVFDELPFEDERIDSQLIADYLDINVEFIANDNVPLLIQNGIIDPTSPYKGWEQTEHNLLKHFRTQGGQVLLTGLGGDDLV
ncbi:MAG: hypothetical protein GWN00_11265, partial [Aliifodinibius sp.]|nr:hypothetical protein [Fodinibius sp.]NIV11740.1 hypothetical protein [Fodinibius sp.]NIY25362.1 hypothetical protein [Fodinibius sp.]